MRSDNRTKNTQTMAKQLITALRLEPVAVELTAMKEVVSRSAYETKHQLSLALMIGLRFFPIEETAPENLLLWWCMEVVLNGSSNPLRRRSVEDCLHLICEYAPIGGGISPLWVAQTDNFQTV